MPELVQTRLNQVYPVECAGDTLVVTPKGDAVGFALTAVNSEMAAIMSLLRQPEIKHLVVDLGSANYFGSVVLGALVQLGQEARARGGRIALASASADMREVMRIMKVDQMWEQFPSRASALRAVATVPLGERLWRRRRIFMVAAAILVGAIGWQFLPRPQYGRSEHAELAQLWEEVQSKRGTAGHDEWERLERKVRGRLTSVVEDLEYKGKTRGLYGAERFLLYAARDHWPKAMNRSDARESPQIGITEFYLQCADALLTGRPMPQYRGPLSTGLGVDASLVGSTDGTVGGSLPDVAGNPAGSSSKP